MASPYAVNYSGTTVVASPDASGAIVIMDGTTSISMDAFDGNTNITSITFNNDGALTTIGARSFRDCSGLTGNLIIPNSVTTIGLGAFFGCSGLTGNLTIPTGITRIGNYVFQQCSGLTGHLTIPNNITSVGPEAFNHCTGLTGVTIPNSVTTIDNNAFEGCTGLTGILTVPNSVTALGAYAFRGCAGLTGVTISTGITTIRDGVFRDCTGLTGVTIPNGVTSMSDGAFCDCTSLTGVIFPNSVINIGPNVFAGCTGLTGVTLPSSLQGIGGGAFYNCPGLTGNLFIPSRVGVIGTGAFLDCTGLTGVTIPNSVGEIGAGAFQGCSGLIGNLNIPNRIWLIGPRAFQGCPGLTGNLTIPDSVEYIGDSVFRDCSGLTAVRFLGDGSRETYMGSDLLAGNTNITFVSVPFGWVGPTTFGSNGVPFVQDAPPIVSPPNATAGASTLGSAALAVYSGGPVDSSTPAGVAAAVVAAIGKSSIYQQLPPATTVVLSGQEATDFIAVYKANKPDSTLKSPVTIATGTAAGVIPTPPASGSFLLAVSSAVNATYSYANSLDTLDVSGGVHTFLPGYAQSGPVILAVGRPYIHKYTDPVSGNLTTVTLVVDALGSVVTRPSDVIYSGTTVVASPDASGAIVIMDGTTSISMDAFNGNTNITSITFNNDGALTTIDNNAFEGCTGLTGITIPNSVTTIGEWAFRDCTGLTGILTIPNSVTRIMDAAFRGCAGLTGVTISNRLTAIGLEIFYGCSGLTGVTIPDSVTLIWDYAFYGCSGLTGNLTIPNSVTSIGASVFSGCSGLTGNLIIPNRVGAIDVNAFYGCSGLTGNLIIPNSVQQIGASAFQGCSGLTGVTITTGVMIGDSVFKDCTGLTAVRFLGNGSQVTYLGDDLLTGSTGVTSVSVPYGWVGPTTFGSNGVPIVQDAPPIVSPPNATAGASTLGSAALAVYSGGPVDSSTPAGVAAAVVAAIGKSSIYQQLPPATTVVLSGQEATDFIAVYKANKPDSTLKSPVTIATPATGVIPTPPASGSFLLAVSSAVNATYSYANSLDTLDVSGGVHTFLPGYAQSGPIILAVGRPYIHKYTDPVSGNLTTVTLVVDALGSVVTRLSDVNYSGTTVVASPDASGAIVIMDGTTSISDNAFTLNTNITSITFNNDGALTTIGISSFRDCSSLTGNLIIPNSVTTIGSAAFSGCSGLTGNLIIPTGITRIAANVFQSCSGLTGHLIIPNNITRVDGAAFNRCTGITGVTIPNSVTMISTYAFSGCTGLTGNLTIPNSVTTIDNYAFEGCTGLTGILTIPNSVRTLGENAFRGCAGLTGVTITTGITTIRDAAFRDCTGLTGVTIPNGVTSIWTEAFYGCSGLTQVTMPESVLAIGHNAFRNCTGITGVTIPNSVTAIWSFAFYGCSGLTGNLFIPSRVTEIGGGAFTNCYGLTGLTISDRVTQIGARAFQGCSGLTGNLIIPIRVTSIGDEAFQDCSGLTGATIPGSVRTIGISAFAGCSGLTAVRFLGNGSQVTYLGDDLLTGSTGVTSVSVPYGWVGPTTFGSNGVSFVQDAPPIVSPPNATAGASTLGSAALAVYSGGPVDSSTPAGVAAAVVAAIGKSSIYQQLPPATTVVLSGQEATDFIAVYKANKPDSTLKSPVTIATGTAAGVIPTPPASGSFLLAVSSSVNATYSYANSLDTLDVSGGVHTFLPGYAQSGPIILAVGRPYIHKYTDPVSGNLTTAILVVDALGSVVTRPSDVIYSGTTVVASPDASGAIVIMDGTTSISDNAFTLNTNITSITFNNDGALTTIGNHSFRDCSSLTGNLIIPNSVTTIGLGAFSGCSGLTGNLIIPTGITRIAPNVFQSCSGLTGHLTIPNNITSVGGAAFNRCTGLTGVTIPNSVTMILTYAFSGCTGLTGNLTIPNSVTTIDNYAFEGCTGLTGILTIPNSVRTLGENAFRGCAGLTGVTITTGITTIRDAAFRDCTGLTGVTIPNGVTSIWTEAFYGCSGLTQVTMPESVLAIGHNAFRNCTGITGVTIPNSVTAIWSFAFYGCSGLTGNLFIPSRVTSIGGGAFTNCYGLTGLTISDRVTQIGASAFQGCSGLTGNLIIPFRVTSIGDEAFQGCSGFTGVTIPDRVRTIGISAFAGCSGLTAVRFLGNGSQVTYLGDDLLTGSTGVTSVSVPYGWVGPTTFGSNGVPIVQDPPPIVSPPNATAGASTLSSAALAVYSGGPVDSSTPAGVAAAVVAAIGKSSIYQQLSPATTAVLSGQEATDFIAVYKANMPSSTLKSPVTIATPATGVIPTPPASGSFLLSVSSAVKATYSYANSLDTLDVSGGVHTFLPGYAQSGPVILAVGRPYIHKYTDPVSGNLTTVTLVVDALGSVAYAARDINVTAPSANFNLGDTVTVEWTARGISPTVKVNVYTLASISNSDYSSLITPVECQTSAQSFSWVSTGTASPYNPLPVWFVVEDLEDSTVCSTTPVLYMTDTTQPLIAPPSDEEIAEYFCRVQSWVLNSLAGSTTTNAYSTLAATFPGRSFALGSTLSASLASCSGPLAVNLTSINAVVPNGSSLPYPSGTAFFAIPGVAKTSGPTGLTVSVSPASYSFPGGETLSIDDTGAYTLNGSAIVSGSSVTLNGVKGMVSLYPFVFVPYQTYTLTNGVLTSVSTGTDTSVDLAAIATSLGATITGLGPSVFEACSNLRNIVVPNSVMTIDASAFKNCFNLTSITLGTGVTDVGNHAFYGCTALTSITIPAGVTHLGAFAFAGCTSLASVVIPNSLTQIDGSAFFGCAALTSIVVPPGTPTIAANTFKNCTGLLSITLPSSVTTIGESAFDFCHRLTGITLPSAITNIAKKTLYNCSSLTRIDIPAGVTSIGVSAFAKCSDITTIVIPPLVTSIGADAFMDTNLEDVYFRCDYSPAVFDAFRNDESIAIPVFYYAPNVAATWSTLGSSVTLYGINIPVTEKILDGDIAMVLWVITNSSNLAVDVSTLVSANIPKSSIAAALVIVALGGNTAAYSTLAATYPGESILAGSTLTATLVSALGSYASGVTSITIAVPDASSVLPSLATTGATYYSISSAPATYTILGGTDTIVVNTTGGHSFNGAPVTTGDTVTINGVTGKVLISSFVFIPIIAPPPAPTGPSSTSDNAQVTIMWAAPTGSPPDNYAIDYTVTPVDQTRNTTYNITGIPGTATSYTITGLTNYTFLTAILYAVNGGTVRSAGVTVPVRTSAVLPIPKNPVAVENPDYSMTISWDPLPAPTADPTGVVPFSEIQDSFNNRANLYYGINVYDSSTNLLIGAPPLSVFTTFITLNDSSVTIRPNFFGGGRSYKFAVRIIGWQSYAADNDVQALGTLSAFSNSIAHSSKPYISMLSSGALETYVANAFVATAGRGSATISTAAATVINDGGSSITEYAILNGTTVVATSPSLPITVTGLTPGQSYAFNIQVTNAIGSTTFIKGGRAGQVSVNNVTPLATVPDAPTNVRVTAVSAASVSLAWIAPTSNGGDAITSYAVIVSPTAAATITYSGLTATVSGLTSGAVYKFTVAATNSVGQGTNATASSPCIIPSADPTATVLNSIIDGANSYVASPATVATADITQPTVLASIILAASQIPSIYTSLQPSTTTLSDADSVALATALSALPGRTTGTIATPITVAVPSAGQLPFPTGSGSYFAAIPSSVNATYTYAGSADTLVVSGGVQTFYPGGTGTGTVLSLGASYVVTPTAGIGFPLLVNYLGSFSSSPIQIQNVVATEGTNTVSVKWDPVVGILTYYIYIYEATTDTHVMTYYASYGHIQAVSTYNNMDTLVIKTLGGGFSYKFKVGVSYTAPISDFSNVIYHYSAPYVVSTSNPTKLILPLVAPGFTYTVVSPLVGTVDLTPGTAIMNGGYDPANISYDFRSGSFSNTGVTLPIPITAGTNNSTTFTINTINLTNPSGTTVINNPTRLPGMKVVYVHTVPGAPVNLAISSPYSISDTSLTLTWTQPPSSTAFTQVYGYEVSVAPAAGTTATVTFLPGSGGNAVITGLVPGTIYNFSVASTNTAGRGNVATISNAPSIQYVLLPANATPEQKIVVTNANALIASTNQYLAGATTASLAVVVLAASVYPALYGKLSSFASELLTVDDSNALAMALQNSAPACISQGTIPTPIYIDIPVPTNSSDPNYHLNASVPLSAASYFMAIDPNAMANFTVRIGGNPGPIITCAGGVFGPDVIDNLGNPICPFSLGSVITGINIGRTFTPRIDYIVPWPPTPNGKPISAAVNNLVGSANSYVSDPNTVATADITQPMVLASIVLAAAQNPDIYAALQTPNAAAKTLSDTDSTALATVLSSLSPSRTTGNVSTPITVATPSSTNELPLPTGVGSYFAAIPTNVNATYTYAGSADTLVVSGGVQTFYSGGVGTVLNLGTIYAITPLVGLPIPLQMTYKGSGSYNFLTLTSTSDPNDPTSVTVTWDNLNPSQFAYYYNDQVVRTTLLSSTDTSYTVTGLGAGKTYKFVLTLQNNVAITTYYSTLAFSDPSDGDTSIDDDSSVVITWEPPPGATSYDLEVTDDMGTQLISPATPGQLVSGLYYDTMYTFTLTIRYNTGTMPTTVVATYTTGPCFLADAPVLTPAGYLPIATLRVGDLVVTATGERLPIVSIKKIRALPLPNSLPYLIPAGLYGAFQNLPISPHHLVRQPGKEARHLGLANHPMTEPWDYYNLELTDHAADMVVAGVVVETWKPWDGVERT